MNKKEKRRNARTPFRSKSGEPPGRPAPLADHAERILFGRPSVAVSAGRILASGPKEAILRLLGPNTKVVDHGDSRILPGFHDHHVHLIPTGLFHRRLDLFGIDFPGVLAALGERAQDTPPGTWIHGRGFSLDALGLVRPPTAADLDRVAPHHPVRLSSHDLHALWVNSRALVAAGRPPDAPAYLVEDEVRRFLDEVGPESLSERASAVRAAQRELHSFGVTEVQDHGRLEELQAIVAVAVSGDLRLRISFSVRDYELEAAQEILVQGEPFPGLFRVNGVKTFLDGALGSRTAWTLDPYDEGYDFGRPAHDLEEGRALTGAAARAGLPTFFHAIGDAAVRQALDLAEEHPGLPHRVEHAELVATTDLPRFSQLGVEASVQPVHLLTDAPILLTRWGRERATRSFPIRSLLAAGARVRFGSDSPVESPNPMLGVLAATSRKTLAGELLPGAETIDRATALSLYAPDRGGLRPGTAADLAVFADDPARVPDDSLADLRPIAVYFAGEPVLRS